MPGPSLTQVIGGPAIVTYRGATFFSKSDITLQLAPSLFDIETDAYGIVDRRVSAQPIVLSFVPAGEWEELSVLFAYANSAFGDLITPVRTMGVVVSNVINLPKHNLLSGDAVYAKNVGGALPTGISAATLYYVHVISSDAVTIHTTRALGISGASPIAVSNDGTGTNRFVVNNPLTIQTIDPVGGRLITLFNAAITKMPNINATATATLLDEVTFEAFLVDGSAPSDAASLYSNISSPYQGDTTFNPVNILTQPIAVSWGSTVPWDSFYTKDGVRISFDLALQNVDIDGYGILSKRISDLSVSASCTPIGVQASDLMTALQLQGSGAAIGRSLGQNGNDLILSATGFYAKLNQAGLQGGPELFSRSKDQTGEITFVATRKFTGGVPQPLFVVGTAAIT
jgi:hypothetical protein